MNEPFGDTHPQAKPIVFQCLDDLYPNEATMQKKRVLTLAREMMLATLSGVARIDYGSFGEYVLRAERWIRAEDAYVLPEDMQ